MLEFIDGTKVTPESHIHTSLVIWHILSNGTVLHLLTLVVNIMNPLLKYLRGVGHAGHSDIDDSDGGVKSRRVSDGTRWEGVQIEAERVHWSTSVLLDTSFFWIDENIDVNYVSHLRDSTLLPQKSLSKTSDLCHDNMEDDNEASFSVQIKWEVHKYPRDSSAAEDPS